MLYVAVPYVILSNMLSKLLNQAANAGKFAYHPQCQEVKCTYLSLEDEIFVITNGTTLPLLEIMEVLKTFTYMSGLHINVANSQIFAAENSLAHMFSEALGIGVGSLLIRSLSMSLTQKI